MSDIVLERLGALGLDLPAAPAPLGAYRAVVEAGSFLFVSMQGPVVTGRPRLNGMVIDSLKIADGREAARLATLNALAQVHQHLGGFGRVKQVARLEGYVACADEFTDHPFLLDGASDLLAALFVERAGHARSVCGVRNLPGNLPVAVALTVEIAAT